MGEFHYKLGGVWTKATRPYVKVNGAWVPAREAHRKSGGVWTKFWEYDITPSTVPILQLERIVTYRQPTSGGGFQVAQPDGQYIRVASRLGSANNDPDLKMIRVLAPWNGGPPTTQHGGTYIGGAAENWPGEPWSDFYYNGFGWAGSANRSSGDWRFKTYPLNAHTKTTRLPKGVYHFAAWSQDQDGNWSVANQAQITLPAYNEGDANKNSKEAQLSPIGGTYTNGGGMVRGDMLQQGSPIRRGMLFWGNQIQLVMGNLSSQITVTTARLRLTRSSDDTGQPTANIYAGWHSHAGFDGATPVANEPVKLGTLAKGESKWFNLPLVWRGNFANDIKGLTFLEKDPDVASPTANDYSVLTSYDVNHLQGLLHLQWEEERL